MVISILFIAKSLELLKARLGNTYKIIRIVIYKYMLLHSLLWGLWWASSVMLESWIVLMSITSNCQSGCVNIVLAQLGGKCQCKNVQW